RFGTDPKYDESRYARDLAKHRNFTLHDVDITPDDFRENIRRVIYHLDYPVAGPGSFPQYMVSQLASKSRKVVLGGQGGDDIFGTFKTICRADNVSKESYFDSMTHFDFKTLLPALLQVEDRVSMAHGIESRVPFLDHPIVEFAATMPSNIKFKDGKMKHLLH